MLSSMGESRDAVRVVLLSPRNPLNIGAAAREMSNFGFSRMRVVNAYDVAYREARSAVNASAILTSSEQYHSVADAVKDCILVVGTTSLGHRDLQHPLRRLEIAGRLIRKAAASGANIALLFGSEKFGLTNEEMSYCHWLTRIPTREEHGSMNLGQAVAVCLYELIRSGKAALQDPALIGKARMEDTNRITEMLIKATRAAGYVNPSTAKSTEEKIRRMVNHLNMSDRDAKIWMGMLHQILWKLNQP
jgi:tRNA/rRNA methyltransferase